MAAMRGLPPILDDHFRQPRAFGRLSSPSARGRAENPACGDVVEIEVAVDAGRVVGAAFLAHGCSSVIAVASLVVDGLAGRALDEARAIDVGAAVAAAGGLPPQRRHAAAVVGRALEAALSGARA